MVTLNLAVPKRSVDSGNKIWLMVNVMYFAHLFRWFSVRARLRTLPQARQLLSLHYCNLPSLQTTVCVWEWQDPPWDRTCALRLL